MVASEKLHCPDHDAHCRVNQPGNRDRACQRAVMHRRQLPSWRGGVTRLYDAVSCRLL